MKQTNLFFGHVRQKFSLKVLLNFCLILGQFQPDVAYKSVAYIKKRVFQYFFIKIVESSREPYVNMSL